MSMKKDLVPRFAIGNRQMRDEADQRNKDGLCVYPECGKYLSSNPRRGPFGLVCDDCGSEIDETIKKIQEEVNNELNRGWGL